MTTMNMPAQGSPLQQNYLETNEKLILLVKDNAMIYDSTCHRDAQTMKTIWANIAAEMGDETIDAEGWKSKWRNIKDSYNRKKRRREGRSHYGREWPLMDKLSFLDIHLTHRSQSRNQSRKELRFLQHDDEDDDSEAGCMVTMSDDDRQNLFVEHKDGNMAMVGEENSSIEGLPNTRKRRNRTKRKRARDAIDGSNDDEAVTNYDYTQAFGESEQYEDPDGNNAFFRSCSCRMSKLHEKSQSLLRLQISQLFFNAENPDVPSLEITTLKPNKANNTVPD